MKKLLIPFFAVAVSLSQACNNGSSVDSVDTAKEANKKKDSAVVPADTTKNMVTMPVDKDAADFAVEAANGGMMEVELGNYAQQNAMQSRVKDFGTMMVKDHTQLNEALKNIALAKNITLPMGTADKTKKEMNGIMKKTGKDFDKAYMSMMLDDHKNDVKAFEKTARDCKDPEIKSFAEKAIPVLLRHLDSCKAITGKN